MVEKGQQDWHKRWVHWKGSYNCNEEGVSRGGFDGTATYNSSLYGLGSVRQLYIAHTVRTGTSAQVHICS